jgi:hypothetical protein
MFTVNPRFTLSLASSSLRSSEVVRQPGWLRIAWACERTGIDSANTTANRNRFIFISGLQFWDERSTALMTAPESKNIAQERFFGALDKA